MGRPSPAAAVAVAGALAAAALLFVRAWTIDHPYSIDFQAYWLAGSRVAHGESAALYEPGGGPDAGTPRALEGYEFKNIPAVAWAFVPFASLDYATAKRVMWWSGWAALLAASCVLGLSVVDDLPFGRTARVAGCAALLLASSPAHVALRHAQTTPWVLLALVAWLAAARRGGSVGGGVALGAACLVKFPPFALAALDLWRARLRSTAGWLAALGAAVATSIAVFGGDLHAAYLRGLGQHAGTVMAGHNNQSIAAFTARLAGDPPSNDWTPVALSSGQRIAVAFAVLALLGALALVFRPGARASGTGETRIETGAFLAAGIVALPVAWDHYLLFLVAAWIALAVELHRRGLLFRRFMPAAMATTYGLLALPTPHRWIESPPAGILGALVLSHGFLGALLLIAIAIAAERTSPR